MRLREMKMWAAAAVSGLVLAGQIHDACGATLSTQAWLRMDARQTRLDELRALFDRQEVRRQLTAWGVEPSAVTGRLDTLSDAELAQLSERMNQLPAGGTGAVEVLGIVFVVLIVLELMGVTNVFSQF